MSYDQIVSIDIKPGQTDAFEAAFAALKAKVAASETDTLAYRLYWVAGSEGSYRVIESYASKEAAHQHMKNPATRAEMRALGAFMAGPPTFEILEAC
jgi:quinol monooxygenase YgiN